MQLKNETIHLCMSYTPKDTTLKSKFGHLPLKYCKTSLMTNNEVKIFENLRKKFNVCQHLSLDDEVSSCLNQKQH